MLGERIRRARAMSGLSLRQLADQLAVSHTALNRYEHGEMTPSSATLLALARAMSVRVEYFLRPDGPELGAVEYRKRATMGKRTQERIEQMVLDKAERFAELIDLFPEAPVQPFEVPSSLPSHVASIDDVEHVAQSLRDAWRLGTDAIADLRGLLEGKGMLVLDVEVPATEGFDGLCATVAPYMVAAIGSDWSGDRQRFTLAHELGHAVLAGRLASDIDEEKASNRFAGAFLVPRDAVLSALGSRRHTVEPRELAALKKEYGFSMAGWLYRARDLGVLPDEAFTSMFRMFSARGWRKAEPGAPTPPERSYLFEQLVYRALAEDLIGESKAAELLGESLGDFRTRRHMESSDGASSSL
jgi:Zn-dependent peptidase ImmA (M78 family)/DNA-binding XRE family transcriptional regulator